MKHTSSDITLKPASELRQMLERKEISSTELTQACIDKTLKLEPKLHSFITLDPEQALEQAAASDKRRLSHTPPLSPLDGIPVSLKDNICVKNRKLTSGSKMLENFISPYDATVTTKLKNSGAVLWGATNLDEFAMGSSTEHSYFGPTNNPWNTQCVPGGSSGGSAAAVAAGQAILSLGSDTGGSIRQPAAYCGISGFKPTYGLISRYGLSAFASSLDQIGPFAHTVKDIALILQVIAGHDPFDSTSYKADIPDYTKALTPPPGHKFTLGIPKEYFADGLTPDVRSAVENTIQFYKSQGHKIKEISLPHTDLAVPVYYIIAPAEASSNLARYDGIRYTHRTKKDVDAIQIYFQSRAEAFGPEVQRRIMLGTYVLSSGYYDAYYLKAQKVRNLIRQDFLNAFKDVDAILTPTVPGTAFIKGTKSNDPVAMYLEDIFTISVNLAGLPGISIPCGFCKENKPIGFQLIGKPYQEAELLSIANIFDENHTFNTQHPTL